MDIYDIVRGMLSSDKFGEILNRYKQKKPVPMRIRKRIFGAAIMWPSAKIPWSVLKESLSNIPVVRRGTAPYREASEGVQLTEIIPQGFDVLHWISATDLNNYKTQGLKNIQSYLDIIQFAKMRKIEKSTEALCAQALTGKISYPMKTEDGALDTFDVDFGRTQSYTFAKSLLDPTATIADVFSALQEMDAKLQDKGYGDDVVTLCGKTLFAKIIDLASNVKSNVLSVTFGNKSVNIGGYEVELENGSYDTVIAGNKATQKTVPDDQMVMVDIAAGHNFYYAAIDDLDANLQALPFFTKPIKKDAPSGIDLNIQSKPLPAVVVDAICWSSDALKPVAGK